MEDAIQKAARSRYGSETEVRAEINPKTGEIKLQRLLEVVETFGVKLEGVAAGEPDTVRLPLELLADARLVLTDELVAASLKAAKRQARTDLDEVDEPAAH
jgi:hypothetical protein